MRLVPRQRNAPLDRMVAEYMILANNLWGGLLHQHGVPGIYRSQQAGRVRMSTQALPHEAIGVPQYAWSTSPLRLRGPGQPVAADRGGRARRVGAPGRALRRATPTCAIIGAFDAQYATWAEFQSAMERYWCLRWLKQHNITRTVAHVRADDLVRFGNAPLVTRVGGMPELERGTAVEIDILGMDEPRRTGLPLLGQLAPPPRRNRKPDRARHPAPAGRRPATARSFQSAMERYWCLRWLKQHNITRTVAHVLRDDLVRFGNAPLVTRVGGMPELERGTAVEIDILGMDELSLELDCRYLGQLAPAAQAEPQA